MAKTETVKDIVPVLRKETSPIIEGARSLKIVDAKTMGEAAEMLTTINKSLDRITAEKEKITKPLNQALKAERARWKPLEDLHEETIAALRRNMSVYQTKQKKIADAKAQKLADRVDRGTMKPETAVRKIDEIDAPAQSVATEEGLVKFKTVKKFEVIDLNALAEYRDAQGNAYVLADETKIRKAMHAGVEVAGVKYFTEQEAVNLR